MKSRTVKYQDKDMTCIGYFFYDETKTEPQATVLLAPAFDGITDFIKDYAKQVVDAGYAAFILDMYGEGKCLDEFQACIDHVMPMIEKRDVTQQRVLAGYSTAIAQPEVDADRVAVMGFCFGGMCALDLARAGAKVRGAVSLHGLLAAPENIPQDDFTAKVLILHGYDDSSIPPDQLHVIATELNKKNVDWQFVFFGHTKHAFTEPGAENFGPDELARKYNPDSARRSWQYCQDFFAEVL